MLQPLGRRAGRMGAGASRVPRAGRTSTIATNDGIARTGNAGSPLAARAPVRGASSARSTSADASENGRCGAGGAAWFRAFSAGAGASWRACTGGRTAACSCQGRGDIGVALEREAAGYSAGKACCCRSYVPALTGEDPWLRALAAGCCTPERGSGTGGRGAANFSVRVAGCSGVWATSVRSVARWRYRRPAASSRASRSSVAIAPATKAKR